MVGKSSSNPMQAHHRQKRQKEVQKNKQQRIKARDEKVVQTKTIKEVQEEIRKIKQRKNLQQSEQQKLQRLEKELKLLKAAAETTATNQGNPTHHHQQSGQSNPLTELDDPRKSVYYDEMMNPYGAPPPGKPRLYHQRGGGVTMDIRYAAVPGEEPPPRSLPPPPPPPPPRTSYPSTTANRRGHSLPKAPVSDLSEKMNQSETETKAKQNENEKIDDQPLKAPSLPPPSKAVQRVRRGKASVDIWASKEEVEYERRANQVDLEADDIGAAAPKPKPKKKKLPLEIYYQDRAGQVQGPFPKAQMQTWFAAGFFPPDTLVKSNRKDTWILIAEFSALQPEQPIPKQDDSVESRIAGLKQDNSQSIEARIAALKNDNTVEQRIAALKEQNQDSGNEDDDHTSLVQTRIAELRGARGLNEDEKVPPPPPPQMLQSAPPAYDVDTLNNDLPYPVAEEEETTSPPPYALDSDDIVDVAHYEYPTTEEPPVYPLHNDNDAYPEDVPYPVGTGYSIPGDEDDQQSYPVIDTYPVTDDYPTTTADNDNGNDYPTPSLGDGPANYPMPLPKSEQPKRVVKVDKEVVAFMPSHLQNRKRKLIAPTTAKPKQHKHVAPTSTAEEINIDQFMEECEAFSSE